MLLKMSLKESLAGARAAEALRAISPSTHIHTHRAKKQHLNLRLYGAPACSLLYFVAYLAINHRAREDDTEKCKLALRKESLKSASACLPS